MMPEYMAAQNSTNGRVKKEEPEFLPKFDYYLDESDPDTVLLRREDGTFVAAFSPEGATSEGIMEAAKEDYRDFLQDFLQES